MWAHDHNKSQKCTQQSWWVGGWVHWQQQKQTRDRKWPTATNDSREGKPVHTSSSMFHLLWQTIPGGKPTHARSFFRVWPGSGPNVLHQTPLILQQHSGHLSAVEVRNGHEPFYSPSIVIDGVTQQSMPGRFTRSTLTRRTAVN